MASCVLRVKPRPRAAKNSPSPTARLTGPPHSTGSRARPLSTRQAAANAQPSPPPAPKPRVRRCPCSARATSARADLRPDASTSTGPFLTGYDIWRGGPDSAPRTGWAGTRPEPAATARKRIPVRGEFGQSIVARRDLAVFTPVPDCEDEGEANDGEENPVEHLRHGDVLLYSGVRRFSGTRS